MKISKFDLMYPSPGYALGQLVTLTSTKKSLFDMQSHLFILHSILMLKRLEINEK